MLSCVSMFFVQQNNCWWVMHFNVLRWKALRQKQPMGAHIWRKLTNRSERKRLRNHLYMLFYLQQDEIGLKHSVQRGEQNFRKRINQWGWIMGKLHQGLDRFKTMCFNKIAFNLSHCCKQPCQGCTFKIESVYLNTTLNFEIQACIGFPVRRILQGRKTSNWSNCSTKWNNCSMLFK